VGGLVQHDPQVAVAIDQLLGHVIDGVPRVMRQGPLQDRGDLGPDQTDLIARHC
jgi:hypothetical protein|tara:strand:+ start:2238 stop:2399 length:162 start_codon:yes stop_codon:yes gene_type:complete